MDDNDCTGEHRLGENDIENEQVQMKSLTVKLPNSSKKNAIIKNDET